MSFFDSKSGNPFVKLSQDIQKSRLLLCRLLPMFLLTVYDMKIPNVLLSLVDNVLNVAGHKTMLTPLIIPANGFFVWKHDKQFVDWRLQVFWLLLTDWWVLIRKKLVSVYWSPLSDDWISMINPFQFKFSNFIYSTMFHLLVRQLILLVA